MTVINTRILVSADGSISLAEPLPAGVYKAIIEVADAPADRRPLTRDDFPRLDVGPWPNGTTFSREEIYGDDGR